MSEMKDKVVNKAVVEAADKVRKIDNTWNRTIAGGLAGASIGLLTSPNITKKIAGSFQSAKMKVKGKDLGQSAKQMKDKTVHLVQDKIKKTNNSDEDQNEKNLNEENQDEQNSQEKQNDQSSQEKQNNQNSHGQQSDQNNQEQQNESNNQANEDLREENDHLKKKIEELESKLSKLLNENDDSSEEEVPAKSNGISIVRQDDVTK